MANPLDARWPESQEYRELPGDLARALSPFVMVRDGPGKGDFPGVSLAGVAAAAAFWDCSRRQAMAKLLEVGVWPLRFSRNRGIYSAREQATLMSSGAAVIGCGGLGGHVVTLLARLGVGALTLCDYDVFDESNLNRQLLAREGNLGRNKAAVAAEEVLAIASHVEVRTREAEANSATLPDILRGMDIAVDCLDSLETRLRVEAAAHELNIPFVHGAIAGNEGFAMLSRPGGVGLRALYDGDALDAGNNAEKKIGVPTVTPAGIAVLEALLAADALLGRESAEPVLWHWDLAGFQLSAMAL